MTRIGEEATPTRPIPDLHRTVIAAQCNMFAIKRPGYGPDRAEMPAVGDKPLPGGRVPYLDSVVIAARDEMGPVGRPGQLSHSSRMTAIGEQEMPALRVSDLDCKCENSQADGHFGGLLVTCYALSLRSIERNEAEQARTKPPKWTRGILMVEFV